MFKKLWVVGLLSLAAANVAYFAGPLGWFVAPAFFLLVPGYLVFRMLRLSVQSRWESVGFSLGFSLLLLILAGLLLNAFHVVGAQRPLSRLPAFAMFDAITLLLLALNHRTQISWRRPRPSAEQLAIVVVLTLLPVLAVGGAMRLNNGASDVLTLITFAGIAALALVLIWRHRQMHSFYPYAIVCFGLSLLFAISLRSWFIIGHDIQREFFVFQLTSQKGLWNMANFHDPYNACMSITILPTLMAKLTTMPAAYVFKALFQIIFAVGIVPMFLFMKRLAGARVAFIGSLIFISFPTFLTDISMLNRQEIAFIFFSLLMLSLFSIQSRAKRSSVAVMMIVGLILSHYASSYVALGILTIGWLFDKMLIRQLRKQGTVEAHGLLPLLSLPILVVAILSTFMWNMQITNTSSDFTKSLGDIVSGLIDHSSSQSWVASYSLLGGNKESPAILLDQYAGSQSSDVTYGGQTLIPTTRLGKAISHIVNAQTLNNLLRGFSAKIIQVFLLVGAVAMYIRMRRKGMSVAERRLLALTLSCIVLLVLQTVLPNATVDYGMLRFFQQALIVLGIPIVLGAQTALWFVRRGKMYVIAVFFACLFLDMSGFVPELLGGYVPQLSLNNYGQNYDTYYPHASEVASAQWLFGQRQFEGSTVALDPHMQTRFLLNTTENHIIITLPLTMTDNAYFYQDFTATTKEVYTATINDNVIEYTYHPNVAARDRIYSNAITNVYAPVTGKAP